MPHRSSNMRDAAIEASAIGFTAKATQGGAAAGLLGWFVQVNWLGLTGVLVAVIGLVANLYFQRRRDKREQERDRREHAEHLARMAQITGVCDDADR